MAGDTAFPGPDLQSILATLAQYAPPAAPPNTAKQQTASFSLSSSADVQDSIVSGNSAHSQNVLPGTQDLRLRPQGRAAVASPKPMIDPATITSWQEGLRCVTKLAAANAQFAITIKRMMKDQRTNEMRWYTERQNLKQTQATRSSSAAKAQSILKSLNAGFDSEPPVSADAESVKEAELAEFDRKIYSAQLAMESAMTAEMKGLGVPFFGTNEKLIVEEEANLPSEPLPDGQPRWSPLVTQVRLMELRRKMVAHLEDLYRD